MARFWKFIVKNAVEGQDEEIELRIEGDIVDDDDAWLYEWFGIKTTTPNAFRDELSQYKGKNITVWIDSYGGSVFAAAGIYNALMEHKKTGAKVIAKVDGKAMSAATIPFMAGDERLMSPMSIFMIHNPLTEVYGYASDLRKAADVLDEVKETLVNAYQLATGRSRTKISSMMDEETYMSARTAIKEGFATGMLYTDQSKPDDAEPENIINFSLRRVLAIQNAANDSFKKFFEQHLKNGAAQAVAPKPQPDANKANDKEGDDPMCKTVDELRNAYPDLVKQIEDAAREEGRKQERARIQDIEKISANISPDLVNKAKFEEPKDAKELAFEALQADSKKGAQYLADIKNDAQSSGVNDVKGIPTAQQAVDQKKDVENKAADQIAAGANKRRGK